MSPHAVKKAVQETLLSGGTHPPPNARRPRDPYGAGGIGSVLRMLHKDTPEEPLPPNLDRLLRQLKAHEQGGEA